MSPFYMPAQGLNYVRQSDRYLMDECPSVRPKRKGPPVCYKPPKVDPLPNDGSMKFTVLKQLKDNSEQFSEYRRQRFFCDIKLQTSDGQIFDCHKVILAASCPYFNAMFTHNMRESGVRELCLPLFIGPILASIIDFMYSGEITVTEQNIEELMKHASILEMDHVKEACTTFLENQLGPCNCIGFKRFAELYGCLDLKRHCDNYIRKKFSTMYLEEEFLTLSVDELRTIISNENLTVNCESEVFMAVLRWFNHDKNQRTKYVKPLFEAVKLSNINPSFIGERLKHCEVLRELPSECVEKLALMFEKLITHQVPQEEPRKSCEGQAIFCIGGFYTTPNGGPPQPAAEVEYYDVKTSLWRRAADFPRPRSGTGVAALQGQLYVAGGRCFQSNNSGARIPQDLAHVEVYNPEANAWSTALPMSKPRYRMTVAVLDNKLYAVGGAQMARTLDVVECFDPVTGSWTLVAPMSTPRMAAGAAVINRFLYIVGGLQGQNRLKTMERYHPELNRWEQCPEMTTCRSGAGVCSLDNYLYIAGGYDGQSPLNTVERFNVNTNEWTQVAPMNIARSAISMICVANKLYVLSGYGPQGFINDIEIYDPNTNAWTIQGHTTPGRSAQGVVVGPCPTIPSDMAES